MEARRAAVQKRRRKCAPRRTHNLTRPSHGRMTRWLSLADRNTVYFPSARIRTRRPSTFTRPSAMSWMGLRVEFAFHAHDAFRQGVRRVVVEHGYAPLQDDRAVVVLVVRVMDGGAADLGAVGQDRLVDVVTVQSFSAERRDQGRVRIDDAVGEVRGNLQQAHKSGQDHQIDRLLADGVPNDSVEFGGSPNLLSRNHDSRDAVPTGAFETEGILARANHASHGGVQGTLINLIEDVLQGGASTGEQHRET